MENINFHDFMDRNYKSNKIISHIKRNKKTYKVIGIAAGAMLFIIDTPDVAFATTSIDAKARKLYYGKMLSFAKWALILKGSWDTINKTLKEDFDGAKRSFFSYSVVFGIILGLPRIMDEIEDVFTT